MVPAVRPPARPNLGDNWTITFPARFTSPLLLLIAACSGSGRDSKTSIPIATIPVGGANVEYTLAESTPSTTLFTLAATRKPTTTDAPPDANVSGLRSTYRTMPRPRGQDDGSGSLEMSCSTARTSKGPFTSS